MEHSISEVVAPALQRQSDDVRRVYKAVKEFQEAVDSLEGSTSALVTAVTSARDCYDRYIPSVPLHLLYEMEDYQDKLHEYAYRGGIENAIGLINLMKLVAKVLGGQ